MSTYLPIYNKKLILQIGKKIHINLSWVNTYLNCKTRYISDIYEKMSKHIINLLKSDGSKWIITLKWSDRTWRKDSSGVWHDHIHESSEDLVVDFYSSSLKIGKFMEKSEHIINFLKNDEFKCLITLIIFERRWKKLSNNVSDDHIWSSMWISIPDF